MSTYGTKHDVHESIVDDALEKLTCEAMKEVFHNYHDRLDMKNVDKYIELKVSKIISPWIPDKYAEVAVEAWIGDTYSPLVAEFMTDGRTMMVVAHEEKTPKKSGSFSYKVPNGDFDIDSDGTIHINNLPTEIRGMIEAPVKMGVSSRGCGSTPEERLAAFKERHGNHPMSEFAGWDEDE